MHFIHVLSTLRVYMPLVYHVLSAFRVQRVKTYCIISVYGLWTAFVGACMCHVTRTLCAAVRHTFTLIQRKTGNICASIHLCLNACNLSNDNHLHYNLWSVLFWLKYGEFPTSKHYLSMIFSCFPMFFVFQTQACHLLSILLSRRPFMVRYHTTIDFYNAQFITKFCHFKKPISHITRPITCHVMFVLIWMRFTWWFQIYHQNSTILTFFTILGTFWTCRLHTAATRKKSHFVSIFVIYSFRCEIWNSWKTQSMPLVNLNKSLYCFCVDQSWYALEEIIIFIKIMNGELRNL